MSCKASDTVWLNQLKSIVLANDLIEVILLPERGGEIHNIQHKDCKTNYLYVNEHDIQLFENDVRKQELQPLQEYFFAGLYTMFPNAGYDQWYKDVFYEYHGDVRKKAWAYTIESTPVKVAVHLTVQSSQVPLKLKRTITLYDNIAQLHFHDEISHIGRLMEFSPTSSLPYIYGIHPYHTYPLLDENTILKIDDRVINILPSRYEEMQLLEFYDAGKDGIIEICNPKLQTRFTLSFDPVFMPYVWLWIHFVPKENQYMAALIPCTAKGHGGIQEAIDNSCIRWLKPGEQCITEWNIDIGTSGE